ncbi:hypothetical protein J4479_05070 [Candidatus Woesearchaeota archaeon]|nr:hypothetical protein [Candidatus Woesearchaeota archaeon]
MSDLIRKELVEALARARLPERVSDDLLAEGLEKAGDLISLVGDQKKSRIRGIGDDYVSDIAAYNALGAVYSNLPEPVRAQALTAYLNQMDNVNYRYVSKKHTSLISEPLAVSDICTARGLYWPGLVEGRRLVYQHQTFTEFERKVMTADGLFKVEEVRNDFTVAYAVLRSDRSSFGADYAKASHPQFLERVIEGIVAMRFRKVESVSEIEHSHKRLKELLPKEVHPLIQQKYESKDWQS